MTEPNESSERRTLEAREGGGAGDKHPDRPTARLIAARHLSRHAERFPDLLPTLLETRGLDPRDSSLAHAIADAGLRRWHTIEWLLNTTLRQPFEALEPPLKGILLSGCAQLLFLDRIPVHAAIDESVNLAKRVVGRGSGGLVNAVLRKVALMRAGDPAEESWAGRQNALPLADGRSLGLSGNLLPDQAVQRLAITTSHTRWLIDRWQKHYPQSATDLALHSLAPPPTILSTGYARGELPVGLAPHTEPGHHIFGGTRAELSAILSSRADIWVQDPASSRAISSVTRLLGGSPRIIIDACAGQGTKTRQLAAAFPSARIIATDIDPARYRTLVESYESGADVPNVETIHHRRLESLRGSADLVLLDVPCSNSGVLARRPEAKYRASPEQLERLIALQRGIIEDALPLLAPKGRILYSTCSIEGEENGDIAAWTQHRHNALIEHELLTLPRGLPGDPAAAYHDGSYSALLAFG